MGFPQWTLWGMGLSALGALIFLTIALLGQSPGVASRFGLSGARLLSRVRLFTGYAYACLLLAIGFFAAGVPLNQGEAVAVTATSPTTEVALPTRTESTQEAVAEVNDNNDTPPATPVTGAFSGPPTGNEADTPVGESITPPISPTLSLTDEPAEAGAGTTTSQPAATPTPRPTQTATSTPSPTATPTPFPTVTPTPIVSPTAIVNAAGSSIWLVRSPGGQQLLILSDGDTIIPLTGHASQGGFMWREVMTVNGVVGWLPAEFVDTGS